MLSSRDICEKIWAAEEELGLFEKQICNVKVWPLTRMTIYYRICQATGVFSTPHSERLSWTGILEAAWNTIKAPFTSPFAKRRTREYLVFDHPRKMPIEGEYVDIYTRNLVDSLPSDETEVFENWYLGRHLTRKTSSRTYLDSLSVGAGIISAIPVLPSKAEKDFIEKLEARFRRDFGVDIPLLKQFKKEIRHHKYSLKYYTRLLEQRRPKKIFLVVSYSWYKRALICAAKKLGIETVELQHGTFSPYHLGYNFPGVKTGIECFPDSFYTFGDYWNELAALPVAADKIKTYGFAHFHAQKNKFAAEEKIPGRILVISQGVIGKQLSTIIRALAKKLPEHQIRYKLHPGEYDLWRTDYPDLVEASRLPNVEVLDNNKSILYAHFAHSQYLVGVFSTAIYEGLAFGCTTFVVDLPGVEYMDYLVKKNMVFKVSGAPEIADRIFADDKPEPFNSNFIFAQVKEP